MLRRFAAVAGVALTAAAAAAASSTAFPRFSGDCRRADFSSRGTVIRAELCGAPSGRVAAVVLHGCGGFSTFDHTLAADLPRFGISTLDVDYFGPTPPPGPKGFCDVWAHPAGLFGTWQRVAADAARSLRPHFAKVAAVGWSLGAGVALGTAETDRSFAAVAAFSALASPVVLARISRLPPTIFLDGGARDIVPPANARALYDAARGAHVVSALYIDGDGVHDWPGAQGARGRARAAAFLLRELGERLRDQEPDRGSRPVRPLERLRTR